MTLKTEHLIGIPFEHGKDDCYEMLRRFYKDNYGIELRDYARPDNWWEVGLNLYSDNYAAEGFQVVDVGLREVRVGDVFLMAVRSSVANHCAIYVGDGLILHHFFGRRSCIEHYKGLWRNTTTAIIRHRAVVARPDEEKTVDLMTLLPANKRKIAQEALDEATSAGAV